MSHERDQASQGMRLTQVPGVSSTFRRVVPVPSTNLTFDLRQAVKFLVKALVTARCVFQIEDLVIVSSKCVRSAASARDLQNCRAVDFEAQHDNASIGAGAVENIGAGVWAPLSGTYRRSNRVGAFRWLTNGFLVAGFYDFTKAASRSSMSLVVDDMFLRGVKCLKIDCYFMVRRSPSLPRRYSDMSSLGSEG